MQKPFTNLCGRLFWRRWLLVVIFFNFLMMLFGMGGSVLVAKSLGERDVQTTNKVFSSTLIGLTVVGVFFSALLLIFSPQVAWVALCL